MRVQEFDPHSVPLSRRDQPRATGDRDEERGHQLQFIGGLYMGWPDAASGMGLEWCVEATAIDPAQRISRCAHAIA